MLKPITYAKACERAMLMTGIPERERNIRIALGVLERKVIDARHRFDDDFIRVSVSDLIAPQVTTVFEGVFGPGEGDAA